MPPTQNSLLNSMYMTAPTPNMNAVPPPALGAPAPLVPVIYRGQHIVYQLAHTRGDYAEQIHGMNPNLRTVGKALNAAGDTVYLPFYANHISSVRLPTPPPAALTFFYTDNLTGCRFFVDTIAGSNDIIVYHANTTANTAGPNAWADVQTGLASAGLVTMHANARTDAPYAGLVLANAAAPLGMPRYFRSAGVEERRKGTGRGLHWRTASSAAHAGRTRPDFAGCCFVCGFYNGATWEFWFQAFGAVGYERPGYIRGALTFDWTGVKKRWNEGGNVAAGFADFAVMERHQFV